MKFASITLAAIVLGASALAAVSTAQPGAAPAWVYGDHPVLGKSAHVRIGSEAVGFACGYTGTDRARDDVVAFRATSSLGPAGAKQLSGKVDGYSDIFGWKTTDKGGLLEISGNTCETSLVEAKAATSMTVTIDGRTTSVPTKGSSAAISKLIATCPLIKRDIEEMCGL